MSNPGERLVCDAPTMERHIVAMARQLADGRRPEAPLCLVGIRTRGVPLAGRLAAELSRILGVPVDVGAVEITLYRDDLGQSQSWPVLHGTEIAFNIDGTDLVLVDDVLFTGRTTRAALNAICDLGRPASVRLAVLVDRGHREIPIQPDVVGLSVQTERDDRVRVRIRPVDPVDQIVWIGADPPAIANRREVPDVTAVSSPNLGPGATRWTRKHLLGLEDLSAEEILAILDTAESFAEISTRSRKKVPALQGRIVFNLFFENSTRTRTSFSLAAKRLSADTQDFSASTSSLSKGESFIDTAKNIEAMGADVMVVRHPTPGRPTSWLSM